MVLVLSNLPLRAGEDAELRFSWWGGSERHEKTLAALKLFEEYNPGTAIKAEYMGWGGYLERLTTQFGAGAEADIIQMDWAWLATFSKNGDGFHDLLSVKDSIDLAAYDQKWLDICMVNGKLNALPVSFTTRYFLWNKTIWERAGLSIPTTWDEIMNAGPVFREKLGEGYYPIDMRRTAVADMLAGYIFQKTGSMVIDPATNELGLSVEQLEDMLGYYRQLLDNHVLPDLGLRSANTGDPEFQSHEQPDFINGLWAGNFQWDSVIPLTLSTPLKEFEWVVGPWPDMPEAKNSGRIGRPAMIIGVSRNSKNPAKAASCISFLLTTPEAARELQITRGVLVANPARAELERQNLIAPINADAIAQLEGVEVFSPSPYFEDPRMVTLLTEVIENISYEKTTPAEGAERLANEIPRLLRRLTR